MAVSGLAAHLALVASAAAEMLVVTVLAEPCEVIEAGMVALRGFSGDIADPV